MLILRMKSIFRTFVRSHQIFIDHYDLSSTGVTLKEFQQRRELFINLIRNHLKSSPTDFTICLPASSRLFMGPDVAYFPFKQQSDFYYFTGCLQSDAVLLFNGNQKTFSTHLFLANLTSHLLDDYERWFGKTITDRNQICQLFGLDQVHSMTELNTIKISSKSSLFYNQDLLNDISINKKSLFPFFKRFSSSIGCNQFLHSLRSIKSSTEQNIIRQACQFASQGFIQTMKNCSKTTRNESLIKSRFQYECQILDENISMAFYPVVAANGRSNTIHYQKNNQSIDENDVIMLDGGCLYKQYSSDITRFWPIQGRFSSPYRLLYEILLTVQKELIQYLNSNDKNISREKLNTRTDQLLIKYLREEMIFSRTIDDHHAKRLINCLSPTSVTHHLGLDVHDCEAISFSETLQSGNVITIEPGLYIPWDCPDVPEIYRGFATRLEDDILITDEGYEILSAQCPKEIDDLYRILDLRDAKK